MILVDTSIWIELLAGRQQLEPDDLLRLVTCPPVLQEVRQGLRRTEDARVLTYPPLKRAYCLGFRRSAPASPPTPRAFVAYPDGSARGRVS